MEPNTQEKSPSKKTLLIIGGITLFLLLAGGILFIIKRGNGNFVAGAKNLFPFGISPSSRTAQNTNTSDGRLRDITIPKTPAGQARMWKIADGPVAGVVFKTLPDGTQTVRYALREDGDIYEYRMRDRVGRLLANNTIPRTIEAIWSADGQSVVLRTTNTSDDIVSVLGRLVPNTASSTSDQAPAMLTRSPMQENISFIAPGEKEGFVHTLRAGGELGIFTLTGTGTIRRFFSSPFSEWIPSWPTTETVAIASRPSAHVGGYFFTIDTKTGVPDPVFSDIPGLTVNMSSDGTHMLVGKTKDDQMILAIATKNSGTPSETPLATLPEKCAWMASSTLAYCGVPGNTARGEYPDIWYQGVASFSDMIWTVDAETGLTRLAYIPTKEAGVEVDVQNPLVEGTGQYLIFTDKRTGSLWGIDLSVIST